MRGLAALAGCLAALGCTNNPYPEADRDKKVLYSSFTEAPKTLDPAVAYTTAEHVITGNVYDTLLEYHYLARPYRLIAGLAAAVPEPRQLPDGQQAYRFEIRPGILFHADPCFAPNQARAADPRGGTAADFAFALARIADPAVNSPVISSFAQILGFADFSKRLTELRRTDKAFAALPAHEQYARAGGIEGVVVHGDHELEIVLAEPNAQILYWFAMPFTTPVAWEAVAYYNGKDGRAQLCRPCRRHRTLSAVAVREAVPLHAGAQRAVVRQPADQRRCARAAFSQCRSTPQDVAEGRIDPAYAGRRMPFVDRVKFYRERESIPRFNKFLQGYYDDGGIIKESFDAVIQGDRLSPQMQAQGHASRQDGGAEHPLHRLQYGGPGAGRAGRRARPQAAPGHEPRHRLPANTSSCS